MHVVCEKNTLAAALSLVQRAVAVKSPLPTLKGILLETEEDGLIFSATDLDFGIRCRIKNQVLEHGAIVLPAKILTEFVRRLPEGLVTIQTDPENALKATVSCAGIKFELSGFSAAEFPSLAEVSASASKIEIEEGLLKEMLTQTEVAVARDETRPVLTGLLLEAEADKLKFVATDGHRLAFRQAQANQGLQLKAIIPGKAVQEVIKILEDSPDKNAIIYLDNSNIVFAMDEITLSSRLVEGKYPPYQQIIPSDFKTSLVVETANMRAALERAEIIVKEGGNNLVKLDVDGGGIKVLAVNQDVGSSEDYVQASVEGEPLEIRFNVRLLLDCFRNIKDQQVNIDLTGPFSPCMIRPVQNHNYLHLVLPVRIS
ncbi:MAG: DNA polymerase III subunit beta [Bacillota bacterium]|jgi:DNA polymerase-3 subunit beta